MGPILRNWRVFAASLFSIVLVAGAYVLARGIANPPVAQASTESQLLAEIAAKDSNGDGLPDWEKILYGIPVNATTTDYFHLGMTDGEAVAKGLIVPKAVVDLPSAASTTATTTLLDSSLGPAPASGTLTDVFAKDFFMQYANAKEQNGGQPLSQSQLNAIAQQTLADLAQSVAPTPDYKQMSDLTVSVPGKDAMIAYAQAAGAVLTQRASGATAKSEVEYLSEALQNTNDTTALDEIAIIAKDYRRVAVGLSALPVPQTLAQDDLNLINAFARLSEAIQDFTLVTKDPIRAMLAINEYPNDVLALGDALIKLDSTYQSADVVLPSGSPGAAFLNIVSSVAATEAASSTKP